jgi:hypothetical protein
VKSELDAAALIKQEAESISKSAKSASEAAEKSKQEADAAKQAAIAASKVTTITCVNPKKVTWKITSVSPKCPAGYTKK